MFLRCNTRKKDGKEHQYWSVVENRRVADGRVVQRQVLYLGEINDSQQVAWRRSVEIFDQGENVARTVALVAAERQIEQDNQAIVRIRVDEMKLRHPRQWGGCWLACELYHQLELDGFFSQSQGNTLGFDSADPGLLPVTGSRQRVASASAVVCQQCHGRFAGQRFFLGRKPQTLSRARTAAGPQRGAFQPPAATLERSVRRSLRGTALRLDQHVL